MMDYTALRSSHTIADLAHPIKKPLNSHQTFPCPGIWSGNETRLVHTRTITVREDGMEDFNYFQGVVSTHTITGWYGGFNYRSRGWLVLMSGGWYGGFNYFQGVIGSLAGQTLLSLSFLFPFRD